ncbi:unnamed protein product, partial [marine sediment metagenome]
MANKKREKPKHLGRGLASLFDPMPSGGVEAVLKSGLGMPLDRITGYYKLKIKIA